MHFQWKQCFPDVNKSLFNNFFFSSLKKLSPQLKKNRKTRLPKAPVFPKAKPPSRWKVWRQDPSNINLFSQLRAHHVFAYQTPVRSRHSQQGLLAPTQQDRHQLKPQFSFLSHTPESSANRESKQMNYCSKLCNCIQSLSPYS